MSFRGECAIYRVIEKCSNNVCDEIMLFIPLIFGIDIKINTNLILLTALNASALKHSVNEPFSPLVFALLYI